MRWSTCQCTLLCDIAVRAKYFIRVFRTHHILRSPPQWNINPPYALLMKKRWIYGFADWTTIAL